ncbi:hypothetical protein G7Y79_00010g028500 [Physcia stellaris]|nr:hypothetical protein G7Y79_00010g028500 [Physcia stellaris]
MPKHDPRKSQDALLKGQEALHKSNLEHLTSMDTSNYSTRALYHFLHNKPNYVAMTLPIGVKYKSDRLGDMSLQVMVAIDETLGKLIDDLRKMLDTVTIGLELRLWIRDTWSRNPRHEKVENPVTAQNINPLFRFCVGKTFGEYWLEVKKTAS